MNSGHRTHRTGERGPPPGENAFYSEDFYEVN